MEIPKKCQHLVETREGHQVCALSSFARMNGRGPFSPGMPTLALGGNGLEFYEGSPHPCAVSALDGEFQRKLCRGYNVSIQSIITEFGGIGALDTIIDLYKQHIATLKTS